MSQAVVTLSADDLDDLDRAILDVLKEGRGTGEPWGIATPTVVREQLKDQGYPDVPVRQTINNRMLVMAAGSILENRYKKGEYKFLNDPREESDE